MEVKYKILLKTMGITQLPNMITLGNSRKIFKLILEYLLLEIPKVYLLYFHLMVIIKPIKSLKQ